MAKQLALSISHPGAVISRVEGRDAFLTAVLWGCAAMSPLHLLALAEPPCKEPQLMGAANCITPCLALCPLPKLRIISIYLQAIGSPGLKPCFKFILCTCVS